MTRRLVAVLTVAAAMVLVPPMPAGAQDSVVDIPESAVAIDCAGWSVAGVPFGRDPDGDGQATVVVEARSGSSPPGEVVAAETFAEAVGTTLDLGGAWSAPLSGNPIQVRLAEVDDSGTVLGAVVFRGACDELTVWAPPNLAYSSSTGAVFEGEIELDVVTSNSCYGTTLALRLRDPDGEVVAEAVTTSTSRLPYSRAPFVLAVPAGLVVGENTLEGVCGSFVTPSSSVASVAVPVFPTSSTTSSSTTATTTAPAPSVSPVAAPSFTG